MGEPATVACSTNLPDRLALAFKKDAWVEDVVKVGYAPSSILVDLRYRQPVAWVELRQGSSRSSMRKGFSCPAEDVDLEKLGQLIRITRRRPGRPRPTRVPA